MNPNQNPLLDNDLLDNHNVQSNSPPLWKWFIAVILLSLISLTTGSPNLYPSQFDNIKQALDISSGVTTFMLTGGVLMMYFTLPTGIFMDHFGTTLTFWIAIGITVVSYFALMFCSSISWLFIVVYLLMAFGSSSLFIVNLEIVLSKTPQNIKGFSTSIVSASLSLSFGLFLEIFKLGKKETIFKCRGYECVFSSFQVVALVIMVVVLIASPIAFYFFRQFKPPLHKANGNDTLKPKLNPFSIFRQIRLYILFIAFLLTVFDGLLVVSGGSFIWKLYGKGYPDGASDWGIGFSVMNCIFTILLSALLDFLIHQFSFGRSKIFGIFWVLLSLIPILVGIIFKSSDNETLFGIFVSLMGIPFGFGLAQIPALVSDYFGDNLFGFGFGVVALSAIIPSVSTMPLVQIMNKNAAMFTFFGCASMHLIIGFSMMRVQALNKIEDDQTKSSQEEMKT